MLNKTFNTKYKKYANPAVSFFKTRIFEHKKLKIVGISIIIFSGILIVTGISLSFLYWVYPYAFSLGGFMIGTFSFFFFMAYYRGLPSLKYARDLFEKEDKKKFLEIIDYQCVLNYERNSLMKFSIAALVDLKSRELGKYLYGKIEGVKYYSRLVQKPYTEPFEILAIKLGYQSPQEFYEEFNESIEVGEPKKLIPITKVHYIDKIPSIAKCMISKLVLNFNDDEILACPNCGNMAKKELLEEWLNTHVVCPICQEKISIDDCPVVVIKKKNRF